MVQKWANVNCKINSNHTTYQMTYIGLCNTYEKLEPTYDSLFWQCNADSVFLLLKAWWTPGEGRGPLTILHVPAQKPEAKLVSVGRDLMVWYQTCIPQALPEAYLLTALTCCLPLEEPTLQSRWSRDTECDYECEYISLHWRPIFIRQSSQM